MGWTLCCSWRSGRPLSAYGVWALIECISGAGRYIFNRRTGGFFVIGRGTGGFIIGRGTGGFIIGRGAGGFVIGRGTGGVVVL